MENTNSLQNNKDRSEKISTYILLMENKYSKNDYINERTNYIQVFQR